MDINEENKENLQPEKANEQPPSLLEMEERLANNEGEGIFTCPQCGTGVAADATQCPGCNAIFDEVPTSTFSEEEHMPSVADLSEEQITGSENEPEVEQEEVAPPQIVAPAREPQKDRRFEGALSEYYEKRKKRYLFGALSLGVGIILFVMLWLVVVHQVLVTNTDSVFGFEVLLLLVVAGVFFILGLYLTLTYPSSSLSKLLTSMAMNIDYDNKNPPPR
jgi:predicted RNA-binding Zn-ribbon protein involved in translation (DUF1610 family)